MKKPIPLLCAFLSMSASSMAATIAEWNFTSGTEGWTASNTTGLAASGGLISGTASNNDPALNLTGQTIVLSSGETWETIEFRVRETSGGTITGADFLSGSIVNVFNATGLTVQYNGSSVGIAATPTSVDSGDGFFTVTYNISAVPASTTIASLRVDPIGGALANSNSETNGNLYEVDYIRITAIPEPSAALLLGIGAAGGLLRRRRR